MKIFSFASKNPERQSELRSGVEEILGSKSYALEFAMDEQEANEKIATAEILLAHSMTPELLSHAKTLKWIHLSSAGVEKDLFPELIKSSIQLTNSRGIHARPMSEWTAAVLYYIAQRFDLSQMWREDRDWETHRKEMFEQRFVLEGMRALVVGYGAVGQPIATRLQAMGIKCEAVATQARDEAIKIHVISDLPKVIGKFDIVVIALPWTPKTDKLFDEALFSKMKAGAILVNLARGKVVDEAVMIEALMIGRLSFAALDVFNEEPLPKDSPLFDIPNLVMTPHVSGNFTNYTRDVHTLFLENLRLYVSGKPLKNVVDKARGY